MRYIAICAPLVLTMLSACAVPTIYMATRTADRSGCPVDTVTIDGQNPEAGNGQFAWTARCEERVINCRHEIVDHEVVLECLETPESFMRTAQQTAASKIARENDCDVAGVSVVQQVKAPSPAGATYRLAGCGAQFLCDVSPGEGATCNAVPADEAVEAVAPPTPPTPPTTPAIPPPPPTMPVDAPAPGPVLPPAPPPEVSLSADEINAVVRELEGTILQDCPLAETPPSATFQILINSVGSAEFVSAEPALTSETEGCVRQLVEGLQFRATTDEPRTITTEQIRIVPEQYPQPE